MPRNDKTDFYWQKHINGAKHYVKGLDWLAARTNEIRLLEIYKVNPVKNATKIAVYLEAGVIYHALFNSYEEASRFAVQTKFNHSNKEIHSI